MLYLYQNEAGEVKVYRNKRARKGTIFLGGITEKFVLEMLSPSKFFFFGKGYAGEEVDSVAESHRFEESEKRFGPCEDDVETCCPYVGMLPEESGKEFGSVLRF